MTDNAPATTPKTLPSTALNPPWSNLLGGCPFADPHEQVQYEALRREVFAAEPPRDIFEAILLRDFAIEEVNQRRSRRAKATLVMLSRPAAAREILDPGAHHFAPGAAGYQPDAPAYERFMEELARRDASRGLPSSEAWSAVSATTTLEAAALAELGKSNIGAEGINDQAHILVLDTTERLEALASKQIERRNDALDALQRRRASLARVDRVQVIDAEVDA